MGDCAARCGWARVSDAPPTLSGSSSFGKTKGRMEGMGKEGNEGLAHRTARFLELTISPYLTLKAALSRFTT